ncbi:MAG: DUF1501 domain-containing protein [Verrucomicrobiales bacterium]
MLCNNSSPLPISRRDLLRRAGLGFGSLALGDLLSAAPLPDVAPRAKSVIWLFMEGGPSGFDLLDHKPALDRHHGQKLPGIDPFFGNPGPVMRSPYEFKQHGDSGTWVSSALPHLATCADQLTLIKACHAESNTHAPAMYQMNTGFTLPGHPSAGAWVSYGLGSENQNLPSFVVMPKQTGIKGGSLNWGAGFLPGEHQGTLFRSGSNPIPDLDRHPDITPERQRAQLDLAAMLNRGHQGQHPAEPDLEARIASFELAYRMQFEATDATDLSGESESTKEAYGLNHKTTRDYGTKLLLARRLVERGVRFVQCYPGDQWDAHKNLKENHDQLCSMTDQPIAALLKDLQQRGLLDETLVVWGGEFGRLPISEKGVGRDHNPYGFLTWMAGAGLKPGFSHGETDELGHVAVEGKVSVPDLHATILHLLGLDHELLTYNHNGRDFRLTDVSGDIIEPILA